MSEREEQRKREAKALAALLLLEGRARFRLRMGVRDIIARRAAGIESLAEGLRAASHAANDVSHFVTGEVGAIRGEAAAAGFRTSQSEIEAVRKALGAGRGTIYRGPVPPSVRTAEGIGKRAGDSLADKFAAYVEEARAKAAASDAASLVGQVRTALRDAGTAIRSRLDTIAASEAAATFSAARAEAMADFVRRLEEQSLASAVRVQWVAVLDRATCALCASLDGRTAKPGESFDGYLPGAVHARCRCIAVPVFDARTTRIAA